MKIVLSVLVAGALIVASGTRAEAQTRMIALRAPASAPADSAALSARVRDAVEVLRSGRVDQARRELDAAAREQENAGLLPGVALWQLAEAHLASGDPLRAAATLDRLARAAQLHGDPVLEARALFEATIHYQQAGYRDRAKERYDRMIPLLRSPYMPADMRASLRARIIPRHE